MITEMQNGKTKDSDFVLSRQCSINSRQRRWLTTDTSYIYSNIEIKILAEPDGKVSDQDMKLECFGMRKFNQKWGPNYWRKRKSNKVEI